MAIVCKKYGLHILRSRDGGWGLGGHNGRDLMVFFWGVDLRGVSIFFELLTHFFLLSQKVSSCLVLNIQ